MNDSFLMGTTRSITVQSLAKIAPRAPAKMWCLFNRLFGYLVIWLFGVYFAPAKMWCLFNRQDCRVAANRRYCFYSQAKNQVYHPAGATRCTDSGQALQYRRAPGSAWMCKISRQSVQRAGNAARKYQKFPLFGEAAPRRGDSLDAFPKFLGNFVRLVILR